MRVFRNMVTPNLPRIVLLTACVLVVLGAGCTRKSKVADDTDKKGTREHVLTIKGDLCTVVNADNNSKVRVSPGDWVVWNNETGKQLSLTFGQSKRLFNAFVLVSYADGSPLKAQVRDDAKHYTEHPYRRSDCTPDPGPIIVVCPPNEPNCN